MLKYRWEYIQTLLWNRTSLSSVKMLQGSKGNYTYTWKLNPSHRKNSLGCQSNPNLCALMCCCPLFDCLFILTRCSGEEASRLREARSKRRKELKTSISLRFLFSALWICNGCNSMHSIEQSLVFHRERKEGKGRWVAARGIQCEETNGGEEQIEECFQNRSIHNCFLCFNPIQTPGLDFYANKMKKWDLQQVSLQFSWIRAFYMAKYRHLYITALCDCWAFHFRTWSNNMLV